MPTRPPHGHRSVRPAFPVPLALPAAVILWALPGCVADENPFTESKFPVASLDTTTGTPPAMDMAPGTTGEPAPADAGGATTAGEADADAGPLQDGSLELDADDTDASTSTDYGLTPFVADGEPLTAPTMAWTWIEFPDTSCRDGSPAGVAVSLNPESNNLMLYLEGGGSCFDLVSCSANPANVGSQKDEKTAGIFDRSEAQNPMGDWNFVYVPYCTGDVHGGTKAGRVPGGGADQQFVGQLNMRQFLNRVVPTFPSPDNVVLTGVSAGGFGAAINAPLVQSAFPSVPVHLLDDSGPSLPNDVVPACLQQKWRDLWGLDKSMIEVCGDACPDPDDFMYDYGKMLATRFADRTAGIIESTEDSIIRSFYGSGVNNCSGITFLTPVDGSTFKAGLLDYRESLSGYENFGTWYPAGDRHTWLGSEDLYTVGIGDERLIDWVSDIVHGVRARHVGP